jgi:hypothetical protein
MNSRRISNHQCPTNDKAELRANINAMTGFCLPERDIHGPTWINMGFRSPNSLIHVKKIAVDVHMYADGLKTGRSRCERMPTIVAG